MPIKSAAFKHMRQSKKRAKRNDAVLKNVQYLVKKTQKLIEKKDKELSRKNLFASIKAIDKAAQQGILRKNTAASNK